MPVEPLFLRSTATLAHPSTFYPVDIEVSHHQLRNFISTVYNGKIFYVNKYDVFVLDLATRQRSIVVTVPFEARCLAAAHGWVCVGGETKGDCAFVHVGEQDGEPGTFCHELLVETLGSEIVNSMTMQLLKPELEDQKEEVVVLISNNDHNVNIYSLTQRTLLAQIEHPSAMNYATLSPDSTIMAAVGDENKVYFMRRILEEAGTPDSHSPDSTYPCYDWRPLSVPDVPRGTLQHEDFSFAATFSSDGRLCAVSSQGGCITVFDMEAIQAEVVPAEDAIICSFRSSRPSLWGCVRSMAFSPNNWDILAWAEDHGRIGIADVRQGFQRRQHSELKKDAFQKVEIQDAAPEDWKDIDVEERLRRQHQQRMQALRGHPPLGARSLRETNRPSSPVRSQQDPSLSLTDRERSIIQALQTNEPYEGEHSQRPYSIDYTTSQPRLHPSVSNLRPRREYNVQLLNPSTRLGGSFGPRRRSSVVLSQSQSSQHLAAPDETTRMTMTASPGPMSDDSLPPFMPTSDLTPSAGSSSSQPLPYSIPPSDPWHVIEASIANRRAHPESISRPPADLNQIESALSAERQLANRLERQLADERRLSARIGLELDDRERLFEMRQIEFGAERSSDNELSPSLERLLHRQLHSERDHGQRRAEELEIEIRNMSRRVNQLVDERDALIQRYRNAQARSSSTSAEISALPNTLARTDDGGLERRLQAMDHDRRQRAQRISDLEHEVRRAESRVELNSLQRNVETNRASTRTSTGERNESSIIASRILPILTPSSNSPSSDPRNILDTIDNGTNLPPIVRRLRPRTPPEFGLNSNRAALPRISELVNRVTDNDLRVARVMMMRNNADGNGNWSPAAVHRYITGQSSSDQNGRSLEEIIRDSGVGTAGIGWSPDGLKLFAGSEQGIFEFSINVQDRLQCPILEMR